MTAAQDNCSASWCRGAKRLLLGSLHQTHPLPNARTNREKAACCLAAGIGKGRLLAGTIDMLSEFVQAPWGTSGRHQALGLQLCVDQFVAMAPTAMQPLMPCKASGRPAAQRS